MSDSVIFRVNTKHMHDVEAELVNNGGTYDLIATENNGPDYTPGEPLMYINVHIHGFRPDPGVILVKDYSENEGLLKCLVENDIVTDLGLGLPSGFVVLPACKLNVCPREL